MTWFYVKCISNYSKISHEILRYSKLWTMLCPSYVGQWPYATSVHWIRTHNITMYAIIVSFWWFFIIYSNTAINFNAINIIHSFFNLSHSLWFISWRKNTKHSSQLMDKFPFNFGNKHGNHCKCAKLQSSSTELIQSS